MPHRELRVVGDGGARPDEHRVHPRSQRVKQPDRFRAVHEMGMAGRGGDPPVERLAELGDDHRAVSRSGRLERNHHRQLTRT